MDDKIKEVLDYYATLHADGCLYHTTRMCGHGCITEAKIRRLDNKFGPDLVDEAMRYNF